MAKQVCARPATRNTHCSTCSRRLVCPSIGIGSSLPLSAGCQSLGRSLGRSVCRPVACWKARCGTRAAPHLHSACGGGCATVCRQSKPDTAARPIGLMPLVTAAVAATKHIYISAHTERVYMSVSWGLINCLASKRLARLRLARVCRQAVCLLGRRRCLVRNLRLSYRVRLVPAKQAKRLWLNLNRLVVGGCGGASPSSSSSSHIEACALVGNNNNNSRVESSQPEPSCGLGIPNEPISDGFAFAKRLSATATATATATASVCFGPFCWAAKRSSAASSSRIADEPDETKLLFAFQQPQINPLKPDDTHYHRSFRRNQAPDCGLSQLARLAFRCLSA